MEIVKAIKKISPGIKEDCVYRFINRDHPDDSSVYVKDW